MPRIHNPETFRSVTRSTISLDGKTKDVEEVMPTKAISDWFNPVYPLPENPEVAKKTLKNLTLAIGEVKEFSDEEARFLKSKYTWLKETVKPVQEGMPIVAEEVKARPSQNIDIVIEDVDKK